MREGDDETLDELVQEYLVRCRRGEQPDPSEYCRKHPHLADEIREAFSAAHMMDRIRNTEKLLSGGTIVGLTGSSDPIPLQVGDYRIVREIGRGGMGIVYEAVQGSLGRSVALKVLPPSTAGDATRFQRFEREARSAANLHHTNIVPVIGVGNDDGVHYLVLQLIDGCGLDEVITQLRRVRKAQRGPGPSTDLPPASDTVRLERQSNVQTITCKLLEGVSAESIAPTRSGEGKLSTTKRRSSTAAWWRQVARIGLQVADALNYAASQGVLHRDIKPSNLMIDPGLTVWVTDFGLAKSEGSETLTMTGELVGTLKYLPPERLKGDADLRGDIYALGATLYELASLSPLFLVSDSARLIRMIAEVEPVRPRAINPEIPRDLETIILKAIAKAPAERYQTADKLADDLRNFLEDRTIVARRSTLAERSIRWCRRNPHIAALTGAIAALLLIITIGSMYSAVQLKKRETIALRAERERRQELFHANVARANETAATAGPGHRLEGLKAVREAMEAVPVSELSAEDRLNLTTAAIQCLAQADVREVERLPGAVTDSDVPAVDFERGNIAYRKPNLPGTIIGNLSDGSEKRILRQNNPDEDLRLALSRRFSRAGNRLLEVMSRRDPNGTESIRVWDCDAGKLLLNWSPPNAALNEAEFHPDGRHLLIAKGDGSLHVLDLETGRQVREAPERFGPLTPSYNDDGSLLALAPHRASAVQIVDPTTLQAVAALPEGVRGLALAWLPGEPKLIVGTTTGQLYAWDHARRSGRFLSGERTDPVLTITCWNQARYLAVGRAHHTEIRRIAGDESLLTLEGIPLGSSQEGLRLALLNNSALVIHEFIEPLSCRRIVGSATAAEFSPDGRLLAVSGKSGVQIYDADTLVLKCDLGLDACGPVAFAPDGRELVTFGIFSHARCWPLTENAGGRLGPPRALIPGASGPPLIGQMAPQHQGRHVVYTRDGKSLFVADYRNNAVLVVEAHRPGSRLFAQSPEAAQLAVSSDGRWIASSSYLRETVRVWSAAGGQTALSLPNRNGVAFTPDDKYLVTQSNRNIEIYDVGTWTRGRVFEAAAGEANQIAFHYPAFRLQFAVQPRGRLLAVADSADKVRLFDYRTGQLAATLTHPQPGATVWMAFSRDGSRLSITRDDLDVSVWDLDVLQRELAELELPTELCEATRPNFATPPGALLKTAPLTVDRGNLLKPSEWHKYWKELAFGDTFLGHWAEAAFDITRAIERAPEGDVSLRSKLLALRGEYHFRDQDPWTARDDLEKALQLDPGSKRAASLLARLHALGPKELRDPKNVAPLVALMNAQGKADSITPLFLGFASIHLGHYEEGQKLLESLKGDDQRQAFAAIGLALAAHRQGDSARARKAIEAGKSIYGQFQPRLNACDRAEFERLKSEIDAEINSASATR